MPSKPIELPPRVAQRFARDLQAFFAEPNTIKQDEIAARQLQALNEHRRPRDKKTAARGREADVSGTEGPRMKVWIYEGVRFK